MLTESLKKFGLSGNEVAVYLALLELGKANVAVLTKKSALPRSTVYSVLTALELRGLTFSYQQGKTRVYSGQDPRIILAEAEDRMKAIQDVLPDLKSLYRSAQDKPSIHLYRGREEIRHMYDAILKMRGLETYNIICSEDAWLEMDRLFAERFKVRRAKQKIKTRLILGYSPPALERKEKESETYSEVKIIPPGLHWSASAGCYIFKDRVIFLGYKKEQIAVEILSGEIAELMEMNFEFMWRFLAR